MRTGRGLHVITDRNGHIVAAAIAAAGSTHVAGVQTQITPLEGQSLIVVPSTTEFESLETHEDFRRLTNEFHVPPGKQELVRKGERREAETGP